MRFILFLLMMALIGCDGELVVEKGSGSGTYKYYQKVPIVADTPADGFRFYKWGGPDVFRVDNPYESSNQVSISKKLTKIEALFLPSNTSYNVSVENGLGSGDYFPGTEVEIIANSSSDQQRFKIWEGDIKYLPNPRLEKNKIRMPEANIKLQATYDYKYKIEVVDGIGSGEYFENDRVTIAAKDKFEEGFVFKQWVGDTNILEDQFKTPQTFKMPGQNLKFEAIYEARPTYTLTVVDGIGSGKYFEGTQVTIKANNPPNGFSFSHWLGDIDLLSDPYSNEQSFVMPAHDLSFNAEFMEGIGEAKYTYHGKVISGGQLDAVVKNSIIHIVSDRYYQMDTNAKVLINEGYGDGWQCGMCFAPAISVDSSGAVHTITRHGGDWNGGHDIVYRKRNSNGQWQHNYIFGSRTKRNYAVSIATPQNNDVYMTYTSAGDDVWGDVYFWKELGGYANYWGNLSGVWRSDSDTRMRSVDGKVFFASGKPDPYGTAYFSYCNAGANCLNEIQSNMQGHQAGEGRRGFPDISIDKLGDVHLSYGARQTVYYNRYKQGRDKVFPEDIHLFSNLGDAHFDGIGVSSVTSSDNGVIVLVVAVHNETGDLMVRFSKDRGKTWEDTKLLGVQSDVNEARRRPRLVAIGNKFFIFYQQNGTDGISLVTVKF